MDVVRLEIPEILLITPRRFGDARGFISETYNRAQLVGIGITADFVQDNHSLSAAKGTVRGLHFQVPPHAQDKLIRVCRGAIYDVVVDIRRGSPTFGKAVSTVLSVENWRQIWVPKGFAHGFCTLEPDTEIIYKITDLYSPECDRGLAWNDPALKIDWPVEARDAVLSDRDRQHPSLAELPQYFRREREPI
jgi:dTDP-4-dehydrorhamnose 3,5-epimerase